MSDVVLFQIIQTIFWLLIVVIIVIVFHREIKHLLQSLSSLQVAGATIQLKDRKETLRSYILLAETLIDLVSSNDRIEEIQKLLNPSQIESLGVFALKYTDEMEESEWNEELLKNIAYLLSRAGRYRQSVALYEALLMKRPDHWELLHLKALALMVTRLPEPVEEAHKILLQLVNRYPEIKETRFNYALVLSMLKKEDDAYKEMARAIEDGYLPKGKIR